MKNSIGEILALGLLLTIGLSGCQQDIALGDEPEPALALTQDEGEVIIPFLKSYNAEKQRSRFVNRRELSFEGDVTEVKYRLIVATENSFKGIVESEFFNPIDQPLPSSTTFMLFPVKSKGRNGKDIEWQTDWFSFKEAPKGTYVIEMREVERNGFVSKRDWIRVNFNNDRRGRAFLEIEESTDTKFDLFITNLEKLNKEQLAMISKITSVQYPFTLSNPTYLGAFGIDTAIEIRAGLSKLGILTTVK